MPRLVSIRTPAPASASRRRSRETVASSALRVTGSSKP